MDHKRVKMRRYHTAIKMLLLVCVLFWVSCKNEVFSAYSEEAPVETEALDECSQTLDAEIPPFETTDPPDLYSCSISGNVTFERADDEYWIRIRKSSFKLYLCRGLDAEKFYNIAIGRNPGDKERAGDNRTPEGIFTVQSIEDSHFWAFDFGDGKGPISGVYGPWFIRLRTRWLGIGIHGTNDPDSIGTMVSEGCIRMRNQELVELKQFVGIDMKVVIED